MKNYTITINGQFTAQYNISADHANEARDEAIKALLRNSNLDIQIVETEVAYDNGQTAQHKSNCKGRCGQTKTKPSAN